MNCRQRAITRVKIPYSCEQLFEGRLYLVSLPELEVQKCGNCGQILLSLAETDQIDHEFRRQLHLLQPEEIRAGRETLGLTPEELSRELGVPEDKVARWEQELEFHSRIADKLMRVLFRSVDARSILAASHPPSTSGAPPLSSPAAV
jgi:DNA-binding transcriptional regulator YiaG